MSRDGRAARPLSLVVLGLALTVADLRGDLGAGVALDLLPDPLGWALVAFGLTGLRGRHPALAVAFVLAVVLVPFSLLGFGEVGGDLDRLLTTLDLLLSVTFLVSLMLGVRALTPQRSTRRVAVAVIVVDCLVTAAGLLAQLLGRSDAPVEVSGVSEVAFGAAVLAFFGLVAAFLVWLYRVGEQEPFRA